MNVQYNSVQEACTPSTPWTGIWYKYLLQFKSPLSASLTELEMKKSQADKRQMNANISDFPKY